MKRIVSVIIAVVLVAAMILLAVKIKDPMYSGDREGEGLKPAGVSAAADKAAALHEDGTVILWYADDSLTEYLTDIALAYRTETGVKVKPELVSGVELLEQINHASVYEGSVENGETVVAPDLYITTHDNLMKAYYAGLASEITDPQKVINAINYPQTSLHAIRCAGKYVGYPLYYETNFLLYNKTYMANIAKQNMGDDENSEAFYAEMEEQDTGANADTAGEASGGSVTGLSGNETGEPATASNNGIKVVNTVGSSAGNSDTTGQEDDSEQAFEDAGDEQGEDGASEEDPMGEEDVTADPQVLEKLANMIPATIDDILTFANNYDAPEEVEAIFKWDVSDIFYNYFFVGNYMNVGGEDGDDNSYFNIYNQQAVDCLKVYQNINQFFSIDSKAVTYDSILEEFIEGKTVFTVATTDAIAKIREARENGEFNYDYGVAVLPDISTTLKARGLSETSTVVVNGYSFNKETANDFAEYMAYTRAADIYKKAGRISCLKNVDYEDTEIGNVMQEYEKSVPLPKMIEAGNYWVQLEIAFTKVWNGADPDETLKELNDTIGEQIDELEQHVLTQESIKVGY
ncbi:MAG: sugar ABC transporter substrate-binding protein [Lachnospiraceae bacterium]|nr:sugar ABC transporter substrate-binding protein [Lachnospiraceae bacterium]